MDNGLQLFTFEVAMEVANKGELSVCTFGRYLQVYMKNKTIKICHQFLKYDLQHYCEYMYIFKDHSM